MKSERFIAAIVTLMLISISFLGIIQFDSEGATLKEFTNSKSYEFLSFDGSATAQYLYLKLPRGSVIRDAHLNLTGQNDGSGNYPLNPRLDIGADDDIEWGFNKTGYGEMGHQKFLLDSQGIERTAMTFTFSSTSGGSDANNRILLPKDAAISSAKMNIGGLKNDFGQKTVIENNKDRVADMDAGDIDNDGDTDIVVAVRSDNDIIWYNNTNGKATAWTKHTIDADFSWAQDVHLVDINSDGTLDVAASAWWGGNIVWYNNIDGKGHFLPAKEINLTTDSVSGISSGDMDNDGDMDLVCPVSGNSGWIAWFNNTDGNGTSWKRQAINSTVAGAEDVFITDLDGDGDNDTIAVNFDRDDVLWYENINSASSWSSPHVISNNGLSDGVSVVAADINEDNWTDVIALGDQLSWFEAPPNYSGTWTEHLVVNTGMSWYLGEVVVADMGYYGNEPDGHLDIAMVTSDRNDVAWFENSGATPGSSFISHYIRTDHPYARSLRVIDIGGKPYPDMIVSAYYGTSDDIVWYEVNMSYPKNVRLDIGDDGDVEYTPGTGYFTSSATTGDFSNELKQLLDSSTVSKDGYENKIVNVPFKISSDTAGRIIISNINIEYEYTATATAYPGGVLADELQQHVGTPGSGTGFVNVPLKFTTESAGDLKVWDIFVEYNDYPTLKENVPSNASIPEDTVSEKLIDLSLYFDDDYLASTELTYEVVSFSNESIVDVFITDSHYLGIDSATGSTNDNWHGTSWVVVKAMDEDMLEVSSNEFSIEILPVNDEPLKGVDKLPVINMKEGLESDPLFLIGPQQYFYDVENDDLYFDAEIDPTDVYDGEQLELELDTDTWSVVLSASGDWYGENIPLRIYCDDDPVVDKNVFRDTVINVANVDDDAPFWKSLPEISVQEGATVSKLNNLMLLTEYVDDIDDDILSLTFEVVKYTNDSDVEVWIDSQAYLDMKFKNIDFYGRTEITLRAADPGGNSGLATAIIIVEPVNDPPTITPVSPKPDSTILTTGIRLKWQVHDVDSDISNITYTVYFDAINGETLLEQDLTNTAIRVDGLENGLTYFWRIVAFDGLDTGESTIFSFYVQVSQVPQTTLVRPWDGSIINKESVLLEWTYTNPGTSSFTPDFDVYFEESGDDASVSTTLSDPYMEGITKTSLNISGLENGKTYKWTVIPRLSDGAEGKCTSGLWSFSVNTSVKSYGFSMEIEDDTLTVPKGEIQTLWIKLTSTGVNQDSISFKLKNDLLGNRIFIQEAEVDNSVILPGRSTLVINLTVDATTAPVSKTDLIIEAESKGDGSIVTETLLIDITKPDEVLSDSDELMFENTTFLLAIVVIITILIIIAIMFLIKKRKRDDLLEAEIEDESDMDLVKPEMIDAELISGPMSIDEISPGQKNGSTVAEIASPDGPEIMGLPHPKIPIVPERESPAREPGLSDLVPEYGTPGAGTRGGAARRVDEVHLPESSEREGYAHIQRKKSAAARKEAISFKRPQDIRTRSDEDVKIPQDIETEPEETMKPPEQRPWIPESKKRSGSKKKQKGPEVFLPGDD